MEIWQAILSACAAIQLVVGLFPLFMSGGRVATSKERFWTLENFGGGAGIVVIGLFAGTMIGLIALWDFVMWPVLLWVSRPRTIWQNLSVWWSRYRVYRKYKGRHDDAFASTIRSQNYKKVLTKIQELKKQREELQRRYRVYATPFAKGGGALEHDRQQHLHLIHQEIADTTRLLALMEEALETLKKKTELSTTGQLKGDYLPYDTTQKSAEELLLDVFRDSESEEKAVTELHEDIGQAR